jgi:hypothetical protein
MSTLPGLSAQFNSPPTDDTSSAPAQPQLANVAPPKLKKPLKARNPGALAGAISRASKARQSGQKFGN